MINGEECNPPFEVVIWNEQRGKLKIDGFEGIILFQQMCQRGSAWHCFPSLPDCEFGPCLARIPLVFKHQDQ